MSLEHLEYAQLLLCVTRAMEAWGAQEDGIPDQNLGVYGRDQVNPWQVYLELNARICLVTSVQNCHACARTECGDNMTREKP
jgi:hypothetical protein